MTYILRRLPISRVPVQFRGASIEVRHPQIIVWVSVGLREPSGWDPRLPRFPAILDTGNSHNFLIRESHLAAWAGIDHRALDEFGRVDVSGQPVTERLAQVFVHRNLPRRRDSFYEAPPFHASAGDRIAVCPDSHPRAPRLPLLGLRSLISNRLTLTIDGVRGEVSLRTARRWWWPL